MDFTPWLGLLASRLSVRSSRIRAVGRSTTVNPIKLESGLRPNSAGIPYTLLLRIEAIGFPTFGLLLTETQGSRGLNFET